MDIHFICRGNVLRSLMAETYLRSLNVAGVSVSSSGTNVDLASKTERTFFKSTLAVLEHHGIKQFAKDTSDQLTQLRANGHTLTICMNKRAFEEARTIVTLPATTIYWDVTDIGEGDRTIAQETRRYEEQIYQEIVAQINALVADKGLNP